MRLPRHNADEIKTMAERRQFSAHERLVSTTDLKSHIRYANPEFVKISGYPEEELIGAPHNVVRHPDIPKETFKSLWETVQTGRPWIGMVKNKCTNGDYYWVDAYVTPVMENGKVNGFQSVRIRPDEKHVNRAESLYQRLRAGASIRMQALLSWRQKILAVQLASAALMLTSDPGTRIDRAGRRLTGSIELALKLR